VLLLQDTMKGKSSCTMFMLIQSFTRYNPTGHFARWAFNHWHARSQFSSSSSSSTRTRIVYSVRGSGNSREIARAKGCFITLNVTWPITTRMSQGWVDATQAQFLLDWVLLWSWYHACQYRVLKPLLVSKTAKCQRTQQACQRVSKQEMGCIQAPCVSKHTNQPDFMCLV
jgi:hypothetical protein